jgi:hypothetical protein
LNGNFSSLKKRLEIFVEILQIYEVIPTELFVDMKNLQKIVKVAHKTLLENLTLLNVYL